MKALVFSDIHASNTSIKKLKERAKKEDADLLISCGDLVTFGSGINEVIKKFDMGKLMLAIPGNHETPEQIKRAEKKFNFVKDINLKNLVFKEKLFFGCGGALFTPFHTINEVSDKELKNSLKKFEISNVKEKFNKFIFIMHQPPYKTKLSMLEHDIGSVSLRDFVIKNKPDYAFCGHLHEHMSEEDRIGKTRIINPGHDGFLLEI